MTKKNAEATQRLIDLLPVYFAQKSQMDLIKKEVDKENAEIKNIMAESGITEIISEDIRASYSVSTRQDFVEEALIAKLKEMKVRGVIKKKEYVDMEALENAIYNGNINAAELAPCQTIKEVATLRVNKIKK